MSDFGTSVDFLRLDGREATPEDEAEIMRSLTAVLDEHPMFDALGDPVEPRLCGYSSADGREGVSVEITGYVIDDEVDANTAVAEDLPKVQAIAAKLMAVLGTKYEITPTGGEW